MSKQKTVLRYAGGKSRAIKKITPFVAPYDTIVSPFLGGGSLEVHWASMGKKVKASDIFDILITFWEQLLDHNDALVEELKLITPNVVRYGEIKGELIKTPQVQEMLKGWKTDFYRRYGPLAPDFVAMGPAKLAAYYYFNHNCSYGPGFLGWPSKIYMDETKWAKTIKKVRAFECPTLEVQHCGFQTAILNNPTEFLYLDPPYYLEKDKDNKMLGGIYPMKNIPVHHNSFPHEELRDLLLNHEGDFVMSYNNCETIREWYKDFELFYPEWHYSMDVGEKRVGKNRKGRVSEEDQLKAEELTQEIKRAETFFAFSSAYIADLKTQRHEIMKKSSHEILIVKRSQRRTDGN